jgi:serine/threonine protein kinase
MTLSEELDDVTAELEEDTAEVQPQARPQAPVRPQAALPRPGHPPAMPKPGTVLNARYLLEYALGSGGNAVVFAASDLEADRRRTPARVALKFVRTDLHCADIATERLKREYRLAQVLAHPNIVRVHELDCDDGRWFMTLELLEGDTLAALVRATPAGLQPQRAMRILRACGDALTFAHEHGVVHGDVKPANIFVTDKDEVRVLDFGTATCTGPEPARHRPAASAQYASPEVSSGLRPDHRDDVFSFACIAYEFLNGRHPFGRPPLAARAQGLHPVRAWNLTDRQWYPLEAALSFERGKRPVSIRSLCNELLAREISPPLSFDAAPAVAPDSVEAPLMADRYVPPAEAASGGSALRTVAVIAAVVIAGFAVYWQLEQHPDWLPQTQAAVSDTVQALRGPVEKPADTAVLADTFTFPPDPQPDLVPPPAETSAPVTAEQTPAAPSPVRRTRIAAQTAAPAAPIFISFQSERVTVGEAADAAVVMLRREASLIGRTFVHWRVVPGTAVPGEDYVAYAGGRAEFADNQPLRALYMPLLRDGIAEPTEEFFVELYDAGPQTRIWPVQRMAVTIQDDD